MKLNNTFLILEITAGAILFIGLATWWTLYILRARHIRKSYSDKTVFPNSQSKFETINGVRIHYVNEGKGSHLLLLHGIGANIFCWRHLIPLLAPHFTVWAVDTPLLQVPTVLAMLKQRLSVVCCFLRKNWLNNNK